MTDKQTLLAYRLKQAEETLADAEKMLEGGLSGRSIINRAYYVVFYSILALFLHSDINPRTSKHSGVLSIFDRDFVNTGKIDKTFSRIAHRLFDARQEVDYKELVEVPAEDTPPLVVPRYSLVVAPRAGAWIEIKALWRSFRQARRKGYFEEELSEKFGQLKLKSRDGKLYEEQGN